MVAPTSAPGGGALRIREVRRSDRDSFSEVMIGSYGPFEAMLGLGTRGSAEFAPLFKPVFWFFFSLLKVLGVSPLRIYVTVDGSTVVGTTMVLRWPTSGYILGVGVRPSYRRRGLAGRMIARAEERTAKKGRTWAVLDVEADNYPALTLYRALHYQPIQTAHWLRCAAPEAVASGPRAPAVVRPLSSEKGGRKAAAAWCTPRVPASVSTVLPPSPERLSHLEALGQFPGVVSETWAVGRPEAPVGYVAAYSRGGGLPGIQFFPALDPAASHPELVRLVQEGTAWLASRGSTVVLAAVPDSVGALLPVLAELGFLLQLSTVTMARPLGGGSPSAPAPKGP